MTNEDILAAKAQAKKYVLTEPELNKVSGGDYCWVSCSRCGKSLEMMGISGKKYLCEQCGDERSNIDAALADIDALMADVDGFDF